MAHPKKAAVLGMLVLVALYFWAPLLGGWLGKREPPDDLAATSGDAGIGRASGSRRPAPGHAESTGATEPKAPGCPWTTLDEWIRGDPRTRPTVDLPESVDPFRASAPEAAVVTDADEEEPEEIVEAAVAPGALDLALSSTVVGAHRRLALIGGRAYEQGQTVSVRQGDRSIEFELVEVFPRRVVLRQGDDEYELAIPEPSRPGRIEWSPSRR
jgi:hypothetical protein